MDAALNSLAAYLHLARASAVRRRLLVRDKLLVLAGTLAHEQGLSAVAEGCRRKVLDHNPHHALGRWPSFAAAHCDPDFRALLTQVRRQYPPEKAELLLARLGIERGAEHALYASAVEYAEALLTAIPQ